MLEFQSDSERTSFKPQVPAALIRLLDSPDYTTESEQRVVMHGDVHSTNVLRSEVPSPVSGRRGLFKSKVIINTPSLVSVFEVTGADTSYLICGQGTEPAQRTVEFEALVEGSSGTSSTIEQWELATAFESAIGAGLSELRRIVSAIRQARPLASTLEFDALLVRAAQAHGTPGNIEEWARRLAEDISALTD